MEAIFSRANKRCHPLPREGGRRASAGGCRLAKSHPPLALRARSLRSALPAEGGRKAVPLTRALSKWEPTLFVSFLLLSRCNSASPCQPRHGASATAIHPDLLGRDRR